jgi:phosphoribosylaminoimidazole-succinocarboxamide synthase
MSAKLLEATGEDIPNWHIASVDPHVSIGYKAKPVLVEMIMRSALLGSAWKAYSEEGMRDLCGNHLPDGLREFDLFEVPLVTPTTKDKDDTPITPAEIVEHGLATQDEYDEMEDMSRRLFGLGQRIAQERGLMLADTKFEFGRLATGQLVVIDEALTPDASRYFPAAAYNQFVRGQSDVRPKQQSKEFVREWLAAHGFTNKPGETIPIMPDDFIDEVTRRYIGLYEEMTGADFHRRDYAELEVALQGNVITGLENLKANLGRNK